MEKFVELSEQLNSKYLRLNNVCVQLHSTSLVHRKCKIHTILLNNLHVKFYLKIEYTDGLLLESSKYTIVAVEYIAYL